MLHGGADARVEQPVAADARYESTLAEFRQQHSSVEQGVGELRARWRDARSSSGLRLLDEAVDGLRTLEGEFERQREAHAGVDGVAQLVATQRERGLDSLQRADGERMRGVQLLDASGLAGEEALATARASQAKVREALALVGEAGAVAQSPTELTALLRDRVVATRKLRAKQAMIKSAAATLAVEGAWQLGDSLVGGALERSVPMARGGLPNGWSDGIRGHLEAAAPVVPAQLANVARSILAAWRSR